jgi:hypothetical protein
MPALRTAPSRSMLCWGFVLPALPAGEDGNNVGDLLPFYTLCHSGLHTRYYLLFCVFLYSC